jgi:hypothetical protein
LKKFGWQPNNNFDQQFKLFQTIAEMFWAKAKKFQFTSNFG